MKLALHIVVAFCVPAFSFAATVDIRGPETLAVGQEAVFQVFITSEEPIYTVQAEGVTGTSVEIIDASVADSWVALTQSGYERVSTNSFLKSAGYPGGVASRSLFMELALVGKAPGDATVALTDVSILNAEQENLYAGASGLVVSIVSEESSQTPPARSPVVSEVSARGTGLSAERVTLDNAVVRTQESLPQAAAAVAAIDIDFKTGAVGAGIIVFLGIMAGLISFLVRPRR